MLSNTLSPHGPVARGICATTADGFLAQVVERLKVQEIDGVVRYATGEDEWEAVAADSVVSMNMWGFTPSLFAELEARFHTFLERRLHEPRAESLLVDIVGALVAEGRARVRILE